MKSVDGLVRACTIVTRDQLPAARVLGRSFAAHHPGGRFTALLLDAPGELDSTKEPFELLHLSHLDGFALPFYQLAASYDRTALATYVKPFLFYALFAAGADDVLYLDSQICIFANLGAAAELTRRRGLLLTPLAAVPTVRNGRQMDPEVGNWSGTYDLGFLGVRKDQMLFLDLWSERMRDEYRETTATAAISPSVGSTRYRPCSTAKYFETLRTMPRTGILIIATSNSAMVNTRSTANRSYSFTSAASMPPAPIC